MKSTTKMDLMFSDRLVVNEDEDGFAGFSDHLIPLTSGKEFEEAAQKLGGVIRENLKLQGSQSKRQTKQLNGILSDIRSEFIRAWIRGRIL